MQKKNSLLIHLCEQTQSPNATLRSIPQLISRIGHHQAFQVSGRLLTCFYQHFIAHPPNANAQLLSLRAMYFCLLLGLVLTPSHYACIFPLMSLFSIVSLSTIRICFPSTVCVPLSNQFFLFNSIIPSPNQTSLTIPLQPSGFNRSSSTVHI